MTACATASPCFRTMCESGRRPSRKPDKRAARQRACSARAPTAQAARCSNTIRIAAGVLPGDPVAVRGQRHRIEQAHAAARRSTSWPARAEPAGLRQRDGAEGGSASSTVQLGEHALKRRPQVASPQRSTAAASGAHSSTMPRLVLQPAAPASRPSRPGCARPRARPRRTTRAAAACALATNFAAVHAMTRRCEADVAGLEHRDIEQARATNARRWDA